jgi:oligosaccharide repeat unit polymerase
MSKRATGAYLAALLLAEAGIAYAPTSAGAFWLTLLLTAWIMAVAWTLTRRSFSLLFAAILAAMFLFVIYPAIAAQIFHQTVIVGSDESAGVARALEIAALAQCGMLAGAIAARAARPASGFRRLYPRLSPAHLDRAARRSVAAGIGGVVAFSAVGGASLLDYFVYTTAGGYGSFTSQSKGNFAVLLAMQCMAGLALVLLPLRLGRTGVTRRLGPLLLAALAAVVLLGGGQRGRFLVPAFAAALVWLKTSEKGRRPRRIAAAGLIVTVALTGLIGVARGSTDTRHMTVSTALKQPFGSGNNLFLPLAAMARTVPVQFAYLGGASYLEIPAYAIPRALWPGKPQDAILALTRTFDNNAGLAVPEFGEMYVNFGLTGVVIGSLLLGALVELLSLQLSRSESLRESVFIAVCSGVLLYIFARGAIAAILTTFEPLLVAAALICRRRSPVLNQAPGLGEPGHPGIPPAAQPPSPVMAP